MATGGTRKRAKPAPAQPVVVPATPAAPPRRRRYWPRITEAGVALIALLVSGSSFLINGMVYLRGSEMVLLPPDSWAMYRDAGPYGSDLYLSVPVQIVNAAGVDFGDVVVRAEAQIFSGRKSPGVFPISGLVEPVPSVDAATPVDCPQGARCIVNTGFYAIERPAKLLDVPGGGSRSEYLNFQISSANCLGSRVYCDRFKSFDTALAALRQEPTPVIRIVVRFQFDGDHTVECRLTPNGRERGAIFDYLHTKGWAMQPCIPLRVERPMGLPPSLSR